MEIEEMKTVWQDLSRDIEKQKRITDEIIIKMADEKSSSRLGRIIVAESVGLIVTLIGIVYLFSNFHKLDNWPAIVGGIGITFILSTSIVLGVKIILAARKVDLINDPYKTVLKNYSSLKKILYYNKWISMRFMVLIPLFLIPALYTITTGENIIDNTEELIEALIGCVILIPIVWYIVLRFYKGNMIKVNQALKDIEEIDNN